MSTTEAPAITVDWKAIATARMHPLGTRVLEHLATFGIASPNEMATAFDAPLGNVAYHVKALHGRGLVELADTAQRRGAIEHFYRLSGLARGEA